MVNEDVELLARNPIQGHDRLTPEGRTDGILGRLCAPSQGQSSRFLTDPVGGTRVSALPDLDRPGRREARHAVPPVPVRESPSQKVCGSAGLGCRRLLRAPGGGEWVRNPRLRYRWAVVVCDRLYRFLHRLETPASVVGSAACVAVRCSYRTVQLRRGIAIRRGDGIGVLHLNNDFVVTLHAGGPTPVRLAWNSGGNLSPRSTNSRGSRALVAG